MAKKFAAYADRFSRDQMEKALKRIIELECHMIDRGEEPPGGRSEIKMHSNVDPRVRIRRERPENGMTWKLGFDVRYDTFTGQVYYWWNAYQCREDSVNKGRSGIAPAFVDSKGYKWYSRCSSSSVELVLDHIIKENNGVEIDPKYAPLDPSQSYYWTSEWQAKEERADADARLGRSRQYDSVEEAIADMNR